MNAPIPKKIWLLERIELYEGGHGIQVVSQDGEVICDNQTYYPQALDPKNAPLIAAAPELLAALQDLVADMAERFDLDSPSTNPGIKSTMAAGRAAITKATERTP